MLLVVECKYKLQDRGVHVTTYGDIGRAAMGRTGQVVVNVALVVSQTGFAVACASSSAARTATRCPSLAHSLPSLCLA